MFGRAWAGQGSCSAVTLGGPMGKCLPSLGVLVVKLVKPGLNWTLEDFLSFLLSVGKVLGPHTVGLGGFPLPLFLAGAVAWGCSSPGLDNQGLGCMLRVVQGGTFCQGWPWGTFLEPRASLTGDFCVATALGTLNLQHVVVIPHLHWDTHCGWGGPFYLKSRSFFLNSSEFFLHFGVWMAHSWGVGWKELSGMNTHRGLLWGRDGALQLKLLTGKEKLLFLSQLCAPRLLTLGKHECKDTLWILKSSLSEGRLWVNRSAHLGEPFSAH